MTEPTTFKEWLPEIDFDKLLYPCLVAGGALRDSWFNKEVTDVDVFIGVPKDLIKDCWNEKKFAVGRDVSPCNFITFKSPTIPPRPARTFLNFDVDFDGDYDAGDFVSGRSKDKPGLNVILFEMPDGSGEKELADALFEKFPCSISRIAWSPKTEEWYSHESFHDSLFEKRVYFSEDVSEKYFKKIYPKYDDIFPSWQKGYLF